MRDPSAAETTSSTLEGVVERVVFTSPDTGWAVLRLRPQGRAVTATAVGRLHGVRAGEQLRLTGDWITDRKYGRQFRAASFLSIQPKTLEGIERYLGSGLLPGIGKVMAKRLVGKFGDRTLEVLESDPDRLAEVSGIGPVRRQKIVKAWRAQRALRDVMIFLQGHGISTRFAAKIIKKYGSRAVSVVRNNPFKLAEDIAGMGFAAADRVASSLGIDNDALERVAAGVLYALGQAAAQGHIFRSPGNLMDDAVAILEVPPARIEEAIRSLGERKAIVVEDDARIFLPDLHAAEVGIAKHLARLSADRKPIVKIGLDRAVEWFETTSSLELAPIQKEAVRRALADRVLVITGGPGTGKTTLVRGIVSILQRKKQRVLLAAPTGRAAKRLQETTGAEVKTVHRLLEFDPHSGLFRRGFERPLEADLVLIDEASMLDAPLSHALLTAVPPGGRLVLVGDVDQLPSVGPGRVLHDIIESGRIPVVRLVEIFRQAEAGLIVHNAHRIHRGERPRVPETGETDAATADFFFIQRREPEEVLDTLRHLIAERVPRGFSLDPLKDVQVLTPMRRGLLGTENLNQELQDLLNPDGRTVSETRQFRLGDRVMQVRNNYDLEVFNGDVGRVLSSNQDEQRAVVSFDNRLVEYAFSDLDELALAYAMTVHKSQGSEYRCVILPLHTQHYVMLQRNLLYTAVTRARELLILVGHPRALDIALGNSEQRERSTWLAERLRQGHDLQPGKTRP